MESDVARTRNQLVARAAFGDGSADERAAWLRDPEARAQYELLRGVLESGWTHFPLPPRSPLPETHLTLADLRSNDSRRETCAAVVRNVLVTAVQHLAGRIQPPRHQAEDIVQQAFLALAERLERDGPSGDYAGLDPGGADFFRVAKAFVWNAAHTLRRSGERAHGRYTRDSIDRFAESHADQAPGGADRRAEIADQLRHVLARCSKGERRVVELLLASRAADEWVADALRITPLILCQVYKRLKNRLAAAPL